MVDDLTQLKCKECAPDTPPIEESRAAELHKQVDFAWQRDGNSKIHREFEFKNFRDAFGFVSRVALLAEAEGHHPDFELGWGRAALSLTTHAAKGLTVNDFILAAKIDKIASS
jgi:4a-hydroxytetrahydrobiopterin dehydratase